MCVNRHLNVSSLTVKNMAVLNLELNPGQNWGHGLYGWRLGEGSNRQIPVAKLYVLFIPRWSDLNK